MSKPTSLSAPAQTPLAEAPRPEDARPVPEGPGDVPLWRSGVLLGLTALVVLAYWLNPPLDIQARAGVVMQLPFFVGNYSSREGEITQVERELLPADTEFARRFYTDSDGHQIECSIVLSGAEQRSIHRPEGCLTGQGWSIIGQENYPVPLASGHRLIVRKLSLVRDVVDRDGRHISLHAFYEYWFVGNNVTTPSHFTRILLSNWDRVIHNKAHRWAYVSMFSLISADFQPNGLDANQTQQAITEFTRQIVPTFQINEMPAQAQASP
jgi:hypothetical protein